VLRGIVAGRAQEIRSEDTTTGKEKYPKDVTFQAPRRLALCREMPRIRQGRRISERMGSPTGPKTRRGFRPKLGQITERSVASEKYRFESWTRESLATVRGG
jgi:hypothetical protein